MKNSQSMAQSEAKTNRKIVIGICAFGLLLVALFAVPSNLYPHFWFARASALYNWIGCISGLTWTVFLWFQQDPAKGERNTGGKVTGFGIWLLLNIGLLSGFNMGL